MKREEQLKAIQEGYFPQDEQPLDIDGEPLAVGDAIKCIDGGDSDGLLCECEVYHVDEAVGPPEFSDHIWLAEKNKHRSFYANRFRKVQPANSIPQRADCCCDPSTLPPGMEPCHDCKSVTDEHYALDHNRNHITVGCWVEQSELHPAAWQVTEIMDNNGFRAGGLATWCANEYRVVPEPSAKPLTDEQLKALAAKTAKDPEVQARLDVDEPNPFEDDRPVPRWESPDGKRYRWVEHGTVWYYNAIWQKGTRHRSVEVTDPADLAEYCRDRDWRYIGPVDDDEPTIDPPPRPSKEVAATFVAGEYRKPKIDEDHDHDPRLSEIRTALRRLNTTVGYCTFVVEVWVDATRIFDDTGGDYHPEGNGVIELIDNLAEELMTGAVAPPDPTEPDHDPRLSEMVAACRNSEYDITIRPAKDPHLWKVYKGCMVVTTNETDPDPLTAIRRLTTPKPVDTIDAVMDLIEHIEKCYSWGTLRQLNDAARGALKRERNPKP